MRFNHSVSGFFALFLSAGIVFSAFAVTAPISTIIQAEDFSAKQGGTFDPPVDKEPRIAVRDIGNGNWLRFDSVSFMDGGYDSIALCLWTGYPHNLSGATIRVRLDSPTGTTIATFTSLPSTSQIGYVPATATVRPLSATTGVHTIYLTFEGSSSICDLDKIRFSGTMTATAQDAKTYYVSTSGDDGSDGLSLTAPFRTIQHAASLMKPGSVCMIRAGVYRETVAPLYTGLPGAPLTFQAYNNENAVISGADSIAGWAAHQGSIYKAPMRWNLGRTNDQILVDGKMAWVARSPNVDETYQPHPWLNWCGTGVYNWKPWQNELEPVAIPTLVCMGTNGSQWPGDQPSGTPFDMGIDQNSEAAYRLPSALFGKSADFFKGGLVTLRNYYYAGVGDITGSTSTSTHTTINGAKTACQWKDWGGPGFISYVFALLDAPNEWFRQDSTLYLWAPDGANPSTHLVEAKKRYLGFDLTGKQHVNITGLRFLATSMTLEDASTCVVDRCHFKYISHYDNYNPLNTGAGFWNTPFDPSGGDFGIFVSGSNNVIRNSSVIGSAGSGVILNGKFNTVTNCRIHSCNYMANYHAGVLFIRRDLTDPQDGLGNVVTHSSIKGCSRADIQVGYAAPPTGPSDRTRLEYNDFGLAAYSSNETGTVAGQGSPQVEVSHNWFHDASGPQQCDLVMEYDFGARGWSVHHNVFWKGRSLIQGGFEVACHWTLDYGDTDAKCYNNTAVSIAGSKADTDSGWPPFIAAGGLGAGAFNNLYARGDTATWKFTNPFVNDYTLRNGSPAIDKGKVLPGLTTTYSGSAPDLGAYEYGEPRWVAGADWPEQPWVYPPAGTAFISGRSHAFAGPAFHPALIAMPHGIRIDAPRNLPYHVRIFDAGGAIAIARDVPRGGSTMIAQGNTPPGVYVAQVSSIAGRATWKILVR